jgi:ankyrin repeat protein
MSNIHQAATKGPLSIFIQATTLFPSPIDAFNHTNSHGSYPLHGAAFFGKDEITEYILKMGGNPDVRAKGPGKI